MGDNKISEAWPDYLMIRDTGLHDDAGGLGQHIFTTAGAGYEKVKYVRADLAHLQGEAVPVIPDDATHFYPKADEDRKWRRKVDGEWHEWCGRKWLPLDHHMENEYVPRKDHPQPAELSEVSGSSGELPPLPAMQCFVSLYGMVHAYSAEQMQDYARAALAATGKQQVGEDCTAILAARIALEVELCGSLQRVAKELSIDVGYLSRLARGEKTNPSDEVLEKLGLERTVTYTPIKREYVASPLHPRTKSA